MKKRLLALFMGFVMISLSFSAFAVELDPAQLLSASVILINAKTGEVLYEKEADVRRPPASVTKIMTLLIAIEQSDPEEIVTIPKCVQDIALDSSRVPVFYGEKMPMRDLWYGLTYRSGNDAANAIAEIVSGSISAFVDEMNKKAKELGMTNTQFKNPHGYTQEGHYTTARDIAILTEYALNNDLFREITFGESYTMAATSLRGEMKISHNYSITDFDSPYYYQYARGIKTGYTVAAGQCYTGAAVKGSDELIVVLLRCGWNRMEKWTEAKKLFQYGFEKLKTQS